MDAASSRTSTPVRSRTDAECCGGRRSRNDVGFLGADESKSRNSWIWVAQLKPGLLNVISADKASGLSIGYRTVIARSRRRVSWCRRRANSADDGGGARRAGAGRALVVAQVSGAKSRSWRTFVLRPSPGPAPIDTAVASTDIPAVAFAPQPIERVAESVVRDGWRARAQRTFDVVAALVLLTFVSPAIVAAMLAIKVTNPGPARATQPRRARWPAV